jgi:hypothetical protein
MQEKHLFEYAVIRVVPCVEREEFMNVGVIVYCPAQRFLQIRYALDEKRLLAFSAKVNLCDLHLRLRAFEMICRGDAGALTIGRLPIASRFRWLTAARSTVVQISPVHPGLCADALETLEKMFVQYVSTSF